MPLNINFQQILLHMFNFVILAFGLYMLLYKPVVAFMKKREDHFADLEKQAQEAKSQAEATLAEYNAKLAVSATGKLMDKENDPAFDKALYDSFLKAAQEENDHD